MPLFPDRLVNEIRRLPGGQHSFLAQVCSEEGRRHRLVLETLLEQLGEPLASRLPPLFTSLDNRRFFQAYAELVTAALLQRGPYRVHELVGTPPLLRARRLSGSPLNVAVLSFIHKSRLLPDRENISRLVAALERLGGEHGLLPVVHRWLPHDFEPEPIRRAVELWLEEVRKGQWEGRYAT